MDRVRHLAGVVEVRASIVGACLEVQHQNASLPLVEDTLRTYLRGTDSSSHECQMVAVEPEVDVLACGRARSDPVDDVHRDGRVPMETWVEATRRLPTAGYAFDLAASPEGNLVCRTCGTSQDPERIEIRETVRFEGDSNPDDEAILFTLRCVDGCLGQYSAAFGPGTAVSDVKAMERLAPARVRGSVPSCPPQATTTAPPATDIRP